MNEYKSELIDTLNMLSSLERQNRYFKEVKIADVPGDLICGWFDTGFFVEDDEFRALFTQEEWDVLVEFNDYFDLRVKKLPDEFEEFIKNPYWLEIVDKANEALVKLGWEGLEF